MPIYSARCSNGHSSPFYAKIDNRDDPRQCELCGANLHRTIDAPFVRPEIPSYQSPVTGEWIDSRAARREDLKRSDSIEWEPGMKQDFARTRAENAEKAFAPIERHLEESVRAFVASGDIPPV